MSAVETNGDPRDCMGATIADMWVTLNNQRQPWLDRVTEVRKFVTSPTTAFTEVGSNTPWKNKTVIPILTQISDNLQSQYSAALFPTPDWFRFEGFDAESQEKANLIEMYMGSKLNQSGFVNEAKKLVKDWIIYGNCFGGITFVTETTKSLVTGEETIKYRGPRLQRISPLDCVIDINAPSFDKSPLIVKKLVPLADIIERNDVEGGPQYDPEAIEKVKALRGMHITNDFVESYRDAGYRVDGFNDFDEYLQSQYVELLEFWGDIYDSKNDVLWKNRVVTIADRGLVLRNTENPSWTGSKPFFHVGWRILPDNLYGQGPLDHLVGMQYRIDHLENLKADAMDQNLHPMYKIIGDMVDEFEPGPDVQIQCGAEGDVQPLRPDLSVVSLSNSDVEYYRQYMEFAAGSPRESAGFRTPGEKTAFEVDVLQQGANRLFQDKLNHFEEFGIQKALGLMFELLIRNFDIVDVVRTFNGDEQSLLIAEIEKDHVVADGLFRPMGSNYFAARNKRIQEINSMLQIVQNQLIGPHFSGLNAGKLLEEELGWEKFNIIEQNIGTKEQLETQMFIQQAQQQLQSGQPQQGM